MCNSSYETLIEIEDIYTFNAYISVFPQISIFSTGEKFPNSLKNSCNFTSLPQALLVDDDFQTGKRLT